jgi:hypothetical protein
LAAGAGAGGAERSLLELLPEGSALFLVPAAGGLSAAAERRGHAWESFPLPPALNRLTQRGGWLQAGAVLPLLWEFPLHVRALRRRLSTWDGEVVSLGVKSHVRCLFLARRLGSRLLFDIRDFIRPLALRLAIGWTARLFACRMRANSRAVAVAYPGAEVVYPEVRATGSTSCSSCAGT